jgi:putative membrane protein
MGSFLRKLFWGVILNSIAILACQKALNYLLHDFFFKGNIGQLILLALVLTILNIILKPIIRIIFLPLIWLTLGIFSLVINLIILKTASLLVPNVLIINSVLTWLAASIIISIFNSFLHSIK